MGTSATAGETGETLAVIEHDMTESDLNIVTGAFGFTGKHITRRLLAAGKHVRTLTGHPERPHEFGEQVEVASYSFDDPTKLAESLRGATTLFSTYWIRFPHDGMTFEKAVENSKTLIRAAGDAGVRRIVHISITNPSESSPLPYYRGKAEVEKAIIGSRMSHAILRPNVIFGDEGILINNIAWLLRRVPVFAIPGSGEYQIQPIYVEDVADLAVALAEREENVIIDAVGPEIFSFNELVRLIGRTIGSTTKIVHLPPSLAYYLSQVMGWVMDDVILTREEVEGLLANLLVSDQTPTGWAKLSEWLGQNSDWIGTKYMSELGKHFRG